MKKKFLIIGLITTLSLSLVACNTAEKKNEAAMENEKIMEEVTDSTKEENKMIGGEETGTGKIYLVNSSGTTEDENILFVQYKESTTLNQIGIESEGIDGSKPTIIYLDGKEFEQKQLGDSQSSIQIIEDALEKGIHNVEFIQKDGDDITFYHLAQYEVK